MKALRVFAAVALLFLVGTARADFSGVVVAVLDGDTVDVLVDRKPVRVRLKSRKRSAPGQSKPWRPPSSGSSLR